MPYIHRDARSRIERFPDRIHLDEIITPGDVNYAIQRVLAAFMKYRPLNYTLFNSAIGAVESAKLEFYRRVVAPYEDAKIRENGDLAEFEEINRRVED